MSSPKDIAGGYNTRINPVSMHDVNLNKRLAEYYFHVCNIEDPLTDAITAYWDKIKSNQRYLPDSEQQPVNDYDTDNLCQICFDNPLGAEMIRKCKNGGAYCTDCIKSFLVTDIKEARVHEYGCECVCRSCDSFFSEDEIRKFVNDSTIEKFIQFRNAKLVLEDPFKLYCPNRVCNQVVSIREGSWQAKCKSCKTKFCVKCNGEHSIFLSCSWATDSGFREWKSKSADGCKRCPKCNFYIEKNGGCSHMTCGKCHYGFCWKCQSKWSGGCSAKGFCKPIQFVRSDKWGSVPVFRQSAQLIGLSVALGVAGAAAGLVVAAAGAAVGIAVPVVVVGGPIYGAVKGAKALHKEHKRKKRLERFGASFSETGEFRDELKWGIRVRISSSQLEKSQESPNECFGMAGRNVEGIFIAYPDFGDLLDGISPPLYLIPEGVTADVVDRVAGWNMVEIYLDSTQYNTTSAIVSEISHGARAQYDESIQRNQPFRSLPKIGISAAKRVDFLEPISEYLDEYSASSINDYSISSERMEARNEEIFIDLMTELNEIQRDRSLSYYLSFPESSY